MYFVLTARIKDLFIRALREYWALRPRYADLVGNIQGKYAFKEPPQVALIVRAGSANPVNLSGDHFLGTQRGYAMLAGVPGYPNTSVGWAMEDSAAIRANGGRFPAVPGVYYGVMQTDRTVTFDPLLDVRAEPVMLTGRRTGTLIQVPYPGTVRLYERPSERLLRHGVDYTLGGDGTAITLAEELPAGLELVADYRYAVTQLGPWTVEPEHAYGGMVPGVALNFTRDVHAGDRFAVVVTPVRVDTYHEYGGKWDLTVDLDVIARDVYVQAEIADSTAMFCNTGLRAALADVGVTLVEVSMGGEAEEVYDETADDYSYTSTLSVNLQTEWLTWVPLPLRLGSYTASLNQLPAGLQLEALRDPFYSLGATYPTVG